MNKRCSKQKMFFADKKEKPLQSAVSSGSEICHRVVPSKCRLWRQRTERVVI